MIEKLKREPEVRSDGAILGVRTPDCSELTDKINELVDAVNELQKHEEQHLDLLTQLNEMRLHQDKEPAENSQSSKMERPADPYAEQRKWVGKLCKFWDFVYDNYYFDTLKGITDKGLFIGHNGSWEHCEPVLPDDDIIFKGE